MEKKIEDYLHLYLGCEIKIGDQIEILDAVGQSGEFESLYKGHLRNFYHISVGVKPILRPLSDMTEEEKFEIQQISGWVDYNHYINQGFCKPEVFKYLLSKSFDLFGLIESGLAIDKTKIND